MVKAVIFDFDGVITRTEPLHLSSFRETVASLKIKIDKNRWYQEFTGIGGRRIMEILFRENNVTEDVEVWTDKRRKLFMSKLGSYPIYATKGIRRFLKILHSRKIYTAIASGSRRTMIEPILSKLNMKNDFCVIVGAEDTKKKKPDPEPFLKAAELLKVSPKDCLAVEDSPNGITSALAAKMKVICVKSPTKQVLKFNVPIINNFNEFPISVLDGI